jgi:hypothetical protein
MTVMRSGEYPLGSLSAGDYDLPIAGIDGPIAGWSMTVRELPVQISNLAFPAQFIQPGSPLIASFSVSGDTTLSAYARNATGQPVDELGSWAAKEGGSSITWDGRDSSGNIVPDGTYYLHLDSTDPNGNTTSAETPVTIDGTRPAIMMTSAQTVRPWQAVSFSVIDSGSGLASFQVIIDGQNAGEYDSFTGLPANGQISFSNYYGEWNLGTHNWEIIATDAVGNKADVRGSFIAANPPPPTPPPPPIPAGVYAAGMFNPFAHRPGTLWLWASDALINLRWVNWGRPTTSSSGRETSHVRGRYTSRPAQVQLSQIQVCKRRRVYTHVRYRIVGQRWKTGHYNRNTCRLSG